MALTLISVAEQPATRAKTLDEITSYLLKLDVRELEEVATFSRARAMFNNSSYPVRQCDHCQRSYRGPAVYCSLRCTIAATA